MHEIINIVNAIIMGATVAAGIFIKKFLKNKKIKSFNLSRLLPIFILLVGETLNILYGVATGENIVISISKGLIVSCVAAFGYDVYKSLFYHGVVDGPEEK